MGDIFSRLGAPNSERTTAAARPGSTRRGRAAALAATAFLLMTTACASSYPRPGESELHRGYFSFGFETASFRPCGIDETWWVHDRANLHERYDAAAERPYESVFAEVVGAVSEPGSYGHMGAYDRTLQVTRVIRVDATMDCEE